MKGRSHFILTFIFFAVPIVGAVFFAFANNSITRSYKFLYNTATFN